MDDKMAYRDGTLYSELASLGQTIAAHPGKHALHKAAQGGSLSPREAKDLACLAALLQREAYLRQATGLWDGIVKCMAQDGERCTCQMVYAWDSPGDRHEKQFQERTPYQEIVSWFEDAFSLDARKDLAGCPLPWDRKGQDDGRQRQQG